MPSVKKVSPLSAFWYSAMDLIILFISFALSLNILRVLNLAHAKMFGIENISNFSPESNYPTLIAVLVSTLLLFVILKKTRSAHAKAFRLLVVGMLLFSYLIGVIAPTIASFEGNIDTFHHGEQLAPALAFDQGKEPYKDLFFLHGAGEDVIIPWLSFQLLGQSIGSYYFLVGILQLVGMAVFIFLVHKLFKDDLAFLVVLLWFIMSAYAAFYYVRDIPVWIGIYLVFSIFNSYRPQVYRLAGLGLISSLCLFFSFDRGSFLTALFALVLGVLVLFARGQDSFVFQKGTILRRLKPVLPGIGGYLGGLVVGLILLGGSGFIAFLKTSSAVAHYQGAIFNHPYPKLSPSTLVEWLPIIVMVALAVVIFRGIRSEWKAITPQTMLEAVLFIFSILFFRAATGRPDLGHIAYGSVVLFLLLFMVAFRRLEGILTRLQGASRASILAVNLPIFIVVIMAFSPTFVNYFRLSAMSQTPLVNTKIFLRAPSKPDSFWTNDRVEQVTQRIQEKTSDKDGLFVFSSEPIFYYTTKLHNPTRFSISWFADAQPLENEMLKDLRAKPPKVIIYESGMGFNDMPDYVSMKDRLPAVNQWILANYHHKESVQNVTILTKS